MSLDHPVENTPIVVKKIQESIDFQQSYVDENYFGNDGEDFEKGVIEGMKRALKIVKENPVEIKERIIFKRIMTDRVVQVPMYIKKYVSYNKILGQMIKLCRAYDELLSDGIMLKTFDIDMTELRKKFNSRKDKKCLES